MSAEFDPYHRWLGIPPHEQPPHHYRLLGIGVFEDDPDVIEEAADRQMSHVQTHKTGQHSALSQKLLNELAAAKLCLLNPDEKNAYDAQLRAQLLTPRSPAPRDEAAEAAAPPIDEPAESPPVLLVSAPAAASVVEKRRNGLRWMQPAVLASVAGALAVLVGTAVWFWTREKGPRIAKVAPVPAALQPQAKPAAPIAPLLVDAKKSQPAVRPVIGVVPTTPEVEPTQAIDLLKSIDVERDSVAGQWRFEGPTLVAPVKEFARIQVPYAPPEEYELQIVLEKPPVVQGLVIGLPAGDKHGLLILDMAAQDSALSFLAIEGVKLEDNPTIHRGLVLEDGKPNTLSVRARKTGIQVECNGVTIIDWEGDKARLAGQDAWSFPNKAQFGIGCWNIEMRITKLELKPIEASPPPESAPSPGDKIDLLKLIDTERDSLAGAWRFDESELVAPVLEWARLQIPFEPPDEYSLKIVLRAPAGYDAFVLLLPGDGFERELDLGMGEESFLGGRENPSGARYKGQLFRPDQLNDLLISVRKAGVRVECNGESIIDWQGDPRQLSPPDKWIFPKKSQLGIGCWKSEYRISKLELQPLESPGRK